MPYLTTKPTRQADTTAEKRLRVLGSLDTWERGFTLGQDLDIRGPRNLLGESQSGQMPRCGFELLPDPCWKTRAQDQVGARMEVVMTDDGQWAPQINLGVTGC